MRSLGIFFGSGFIATGSEKNCHKSAEKQQELGFHLFSPLEALYNFILNITMIYITFA